MPRQVKARLTPLRVREIKKPGDYADGNGLYLRVDPSGSKRWVQRLTIRGKRHHLGLGSAQHVKLAHARAQAAENKRVVQDGGDPLADKRQATMPTFAQAAEKVIELNRPTWTNDKHIYTWRMTFTNYVNPFIGDRPVGEVTTADVLAALTPIWTSKPETARRVRQRIGAVMEWAVAHNYRPDNPAGPALSRVLPRMPRTQQHQRAVPYAEAAAVLRRFWDTDADLATKLSFEFLVLTATRSSETRLAAWDEIDWRNRVWTIPAKRMKGRLGDRQEHRVPLSGRALEVLEQAKALGNGSDLIFPSPLNGRAISDATHRVRLESLGVDAVPHGFRSSFRDWAAEQTNAPHAVMEAALAHRVKGQAEAAYARSDLLEKRRILMDEWADYLGGAKDARPV